MTTRQAHVFFLCAVLLLGHLSAEAAMRTVRVASGLTRPLYAISPPGDYNRLFIVEQGGLIRILKDGVILTQPFLDLTDSVSCCGERGLLGLAFHPDYATNGYFYVNHTRGPFSASETRVARLQVSATNPDSADPSSYTTLLTVDQPEVNHNGGCMQFGPDGMLYIGMGDGGGSFDQHGAIGNAQDPTTLLGKLLRLDVDTTAPYIPADNPHVGTVDTLPEIWAHGLRNPWRFSFDRLTGDMYIADVGQNAWEEVNFQPASSTGGENYGWRCMEGSSCTGLSGCTCNAPALTLPISEYFHDVGFSITGGYVYRGCAIPEIYGHYFFADYITTEIWSYRYDGATISDSTNRTTELEPPDIIQTIDNISSFAQDELGELYILDYGDGEIYKIVPHPLTDCNGNKIADSCEIDAGLVSDTNANGIPDLCEPPPCACDCHSDPQCDGVTNVLDVVQAVNVAFKGQPDIPDPNAACPYATTDVDCSGFTNVLDVVLFVNVAFKGFDAATQFCDPCNP